MSVSPKEVMVLFNDLYTHADRWGDLVEPLSDREDWIAEGVDTRCSQELASLAITFRRAADMLEKMIEEGASSEGDG